MIVVQKIKEIWNSKTFFWIRMIVLMMMTYCTIRAIQNPSVLPYKEITEVTKIEPVKQYKDKKGVTHSEIITSQVEDAKHFEHIVDSLRKQLKGRVKISSVITTVTKVDTQFIQVPVYIDSTGDSFYLAKEDNYIKISAEGSLATQQGTINYSSIDTTTIVSYTKKRFLASDIRKVDITNKNPYNKIVAGNSYELKQPKSIIAIGPSFTYDLIRNKPVVGISATFNVLSIKTRK